MVHSLFPARPYALATDGTIWVVEKTGENTGQVIHLDDEGNNLGDGFGFSETSFYPTSVGYFGGRVFVGQIEQSFHAAVLSFAVNSEDPGHDRIQTDIETNERMHGRALERK